MTHYLAFTLGPIYSTIRQARKTRELWAASYVFSALMRELLTELKSQELLTQNDSNLLAPRIGQRPRNGAGIYPDRCYLKISEKLDSEKVSAVISGVISRVSNHFPEQPGGFDPAEHFRIFAAQIESGDEEKSVILKLNNILDALEFQPAVPNGDTKLVSVLEDNIRHLYDDAGKNSVFISFDGGRQQRLPSLLELATTELNAEQRQKDYLELLTKPTNEAIIAYQRRQKTNKQDKAAAEKLEAEAQENALLKLKSTMGATVKFRHKYVCFVKADGDSIGKTIGSIGNHDQGIQDFSSLLGQFADNAVDKITAFGAIPVYAGGDDLLFVAPIQNVAGKHIFDLLADLDGVFPGQQLEDLGKKYHPDFNIKPTLSFGVSVSYYKYPMFESLDAMDRLLFGDAKHFPGKNAVAFRVLKHSGQSFGATLAKGENAYTKFSELLKSCRTQDTAFLTSVMHRLTELKPFLEDALRHAQTEYFFKHHFNESDHAASAAQNYLKAVRELCEEVWKEETTRANTENKSGDMSVVTRQIYAALRFVQFLNQEDHD